jgi:hypothetical protein
MMQTRLILIERIPNTRPVLALYQCVCGTRKQFYLDNVKRGKTKSCGCLNRELAKERMVVHPIKFNRGNPKHGAFHTRAWVSWNAMIQRCTNPNRSNYAYYGGRGIVVSQDWLRFENFYADMGERPAGYSLERKDNDGHYIKGNCVWASKKDQANNRRKRGTCV